MKNEFIFKIQILYHITLVANINLKTKVDNSLSVDVNMKFVKLKGWSGKFVKRTTKLKENFIV
jgi:hypothetical protein